MTAARFLPRAPSGRLRTLAPLKAPNSFQPFGEAAELVPSCSLTASQHTCESLTAYTRKRQNLASALVVPAGRAEDARRVPTSAGNGFLPMNGILKKAQPYLVIAGVVLAVIVLVFKFNVFGSRQLTEPKA